MVLKVLNVKWIEIWIIRYEINYLLFLLYGTVNLERLNHWLFFPLFWKNSKLYNPLKKHTRRTYQHMEWMEEKVTEDMNRQSQDPRVTSDFLVSPLCYICVTPSEWGRKKKKRKEKISFQSKHMSNICLPATHWARQKSLGGAGGEMRRKRAREETKGDSSSKQQGLHVTGWTNYCWHVLCQPARSPTTPALNILFLFSLLPLPHRMMAIAEGLRKFGDCRAKTDHFKAAYLTLAKFFITVA